MEHKPAPDAAWQTPPAYDFHGGDFRIWQGGDLVAVFAADRLRFIALDLVREALSQER